MEDGSSSQQHSSTKAVGGSVARAHLRGGAHLGARRHHLPADLLLFAKHAQEALLLLDRRVHEHRYAAALHSRRIRHVRRRREARGAGNGTKEDGGAQHWAFRTESSFDQLLRGLAIGDASRNLLRRSQSQRRPHDEGA